MLAGINFTFLSHGENWLIYNPLILAIYFIYFVNWKFYTVTAKYILIINIKSILFKTLHHTHNVCEPATIQARVR